MTDAEPTLYETLGAEVGIRAAVDEFYDRVLTDPQLASYFGGVDMAALRRHQTEMLSAATGGPRRYNGPDMASAHSGLDVTDEAFDRVVGHLDAALVELGADDATIKSVLGALSPLRSAIVTA